MDKNYWKKRFSLGLVLDTGFPEFELFLSKNYQYIDNFYFSLPMGDRFHSRRRVAELFHREEVVELFWQQLHLIHDYGIKLEVLFNTHGVDARDVEAGKEMLLAHRIIPDKVGLVDNVYEAVVKAFPGAETVYSFNNAPSSVTSFDADGHRYAEYVMGRQFIRDEALWDHIHRDLHGQVVLLVNNGCSHICGGCSSLRHCLASYQKATTIHSAEYLYALQSVMPYELHDNWIDRNKIDLIKINSRNANIHYLQTSLESYIQGDEARYIAQSKENYALWAHLTWHMRWFGMFDLNRIHAFKTSIYRKEPIEDMPTGPFVNVMVDYTNRFIFRESRDRNPNVKDEKQVDNFCHEVGGVVLAYCVGAEGCPHMLDHIDESALVQLVQRFTCEKKHVYFSVPRGCDVQCVDMLLQRFNEARIHIDGLILRDEALLAHLCNRHDLILFIGAELFSSFCEEMDKSDGHRVIFDFQIDTPPKHLRNANTVARTPLTFICNGVCCLKPKADTIKGCVNAPCLERSDCTLRGSVAGLRRMKVRGDQLYRISSPSNSAFVMTQTYSMMLQYTPEEV